MIYAYHAGRFWRWDEGQSIWKESHLMAQKFERARAALKTLTPESFWASFVIFAAEVGLGQLGACYVLGLPLLKLLKRYEKTLKGRFGSWMTKD